MNLQTNAILCLRLSDIYDSDIVEHATSVKSVDVQYPRCEKCDQIVIAKPPVKVKRVICLHCVHHH